MDYSMTHNIHKRLLPILLGFILMLPLAAIGQGFLQTNGKAIVDGTTGDTVLLKGMGLGGWMVQEGYMLQTAGFANPQHKIRETIEQLIGPADTDEFYEAWLTNHVQKIDIDSLKSWGFNSVRLPMHYNLYTLPIEDEPVAGENTWLTKGFELTDSLISWCKQNQMYVILDLHAAPGGQGYDAGISDYDDTKPSLWESVENRDKTVALWKRLAERYVNEPWVGGYDLINETNWNLPGGTLLRSLYGEITDSIRAVDTNHIIFIEGNWFANDFTGLTPPWDDNMVYSPHKYWSINDQASIQWVLDLRNTYDIPLYLGETGENSNTWFTDAIKLFDEHEIGWAWWPMKKVEAIAGPLSAVKQQGYQDLLDYWSNGGTAPSSAVAKASLMELAEGFKMENCVYQKDVIDAMFRQPYDDAAIPFRTQDIPGIVYASDFDMGVAGSAYDDEDLATYHVSTGNYTAWNRGWAYRNDGVDIEKIDDNVNSNGYGVGWLGADEWMQYDVEIDSSAVYEVRLRVAAGGDNGTFHLAVGEAEITPSIAVANTGGWQTWQTITIQDVILDESDTKLRFYMDRDGFNLSSMEFIPGPATNSVPTVFLSAFTLDESNIQLTLNKALSSPLPATAADFQVEVNGSPVTINQVSLSPDNSRIINFEVAHTFVFTDVIRITYTGTQTQATDGTTLATFSQEDVENRIPKIHTVPGRIEAEEYFFQQGVQLENTTDAGGGKNIAFLDPGDYLDYYISVAQAGSYDVTYRTASESAVGGIQLQRIDSTGTAIVMHTVDFQPTGGWQTWQNTSQSLVLPAGEHHIRMEIKKSPFNMNWFEFNGTTDIETPGMGANIRVFPNPSSGRYRIAGSIPTRQDVAIRVYNGLGQVVYAHVQSAALELAVEIDLSRLPNGSYHLILQSEEGLHQRRTLMKIAQ